MQQARESWNRLCSRTSIVGQEEGKDGGKIQSKVKEYTGVSELSHDCILKIPEKEHKIQDERQPWRDGNDEG